MLIIYFSITVSQIQSKNYMRVTALYQIFEFLHLFQ